MLEGILLNEFPELAIIIKRLLKQYTKRAERKYNADPGSYGYRFFRPDDPQIGGTKLQYYASYTATTPIHLLANATAITVPAANAYISFGWYLDFDPGQAGYLHILKQDVIKSEVIARTVYEAKNPKHVYLDFDHIIYTETQEKVDYLIYNGQAFNQIGVGIPLMYRIADKEALGLL